MMINRTFSGILKRIIALILVLVLSAGALCSCSREQVGWQEQWENIVLNGTRKVKQLQAMYDWDGDGPYSSHAYMYEEKSIELVPVILAELKNAGNEFVEAENGELYERWPTYGFFKKAFISIILISDVDEYLAREQSLTNGSENLFGIKVSVLKDGSVFIRLKDTAYQSTKKVDYEKLKTTLGF